jgi:hypothetical protein
VIGLLVVGGCLALVGAAFVLVYWLNQKVIERWEKFK